MTMTTYTTKEKKVQNPLLKKDFAQHLPAANMQGCSAPRNDDVIKFEQFLSLAWRLATAALGACWTWVEFCNCSWKQLALAALMEERCWFFYEWKDGWPVSNQNQSNVIRNSQKSFKAVLISSKRWANLRKVFDLAPISKKRCQITVLSTIMPT